MPPTPPPPHHTHVHPPTCTYTLPAKKNHLIPHHLPTPPCLFYLPCSRYSLEVPLTWEELVGLIARMNGTDTDGDGQGDLWGLCSFINIKGTCVHTQAPPLLCDALTTKRQFSLSRVRNNFRKTMPARIWAWPPQALL